MSLEKSEREFTEVDTWAAKENKWESTSPQLDFFHVWVTFRLD